MENQVRAVLFDLDGTLLNTLDDLADSMNNVLSGLGFPAHATDKYKYFVGDGVETLAQRTLPENEQDPKTVKRCVDGMLSEYEKRWNHKTKLYEGIAQLLDNLTKNKIKLAIFSNKPDSFTQKTVEAFLSGWPFSSVTGAQPNIPKKPNPTGAISIAHQMGIPTQKFLYVGDTDTDMQTALAAQMHPVAALWGFRNKKELADAGAKIMIEHPMDLLDYIN